MTLASVYNCALWPTGHPKSPIQTIRVPSRYPGKSPEKHTSLSLPWISDVQSLWKFHIHGFRKAKKPSVQNRCEFDLQLNQSFRSRDIPKWCPSVIFPLGDLNILYECLVSVDIIFCHYCEKIKLKKQNSIETLQVCSGDKCESWVVWPIHIYTQFTHLSHNYFNLQCIFNSTYKILG